MNIECYFLSVVEHASLHLFVLTHSLPSISMVDGHMLQEKTSDRKKKKTGITVDDFRAVSWEA